MTRNRRDELLRSLAMSTGPVVVVDNGSRDGTPAALGGLEPDRITSFALPRNIGARARNLGASLARTPLIAFADDDSWWDDGALSLAADLFDAHPRLGLLAARIEVGAERLLDPVCESMRCSPLGRAADLPGPEILGFVACAAVVRRDAFLGVGGFDTVVFFGGEEERVALDLAAAGWALCFVDDVVARHQPSVAERESDRRHRARLETNAVLTAVMRRPWGVVRRRQQARTARRLDGPVTTARRHARALLARRPVPHDVERRAHLLEEAFLDPPYG
jgi:GT2 family glycosyltransferase